MTSSSRRPSSEVNLEITVPTVRVEVRRGPSLGTMSTPRALAEARQRGLDLVLQAPLADPPLCEIMDMSRYIYNEEVEAQSTDAPQPAADPISLLPIPTKCKTVLANVVLPERLLEFRLDYNRVGLVRLDKYVEWYRQIEQIAFANTCRRLGREPEISRFFVSPNPIDLSHYYRLGEMDIGKTLCIKQDSGIIISIDIAGVDGYSAPVFINTDLTRFAQFITILNNARDEDLATIRARLTALDPKAMEDRDQGFWSTITEEFEAEIE